MFCVLNTKTRKMMNYNSEHKAMKPCMARTASQQIDACEREKYNIFYIYKCIMCLLLSGFPLWFKKTVNDKTILATTADHNSATAVDIQPYTQHH